MQSLTVQVGNLIIKLCTDNLMIHQKLATRFQNFITYGYTAQYAITFTLTEELVRNPWLEPVLDWEDEECRISAAGITGSIHAETKTASFNVSPARTIYEVEQIIRITAAIWIYESGGLLLHGAGLIKDNKGYLFTGVSGAGKTTVCRVSKRAFILNDDLVAIMPGDEGWQIWSTPFTNPTQVIPNSGHTGLYSMLKLIQAKEHHLVEMTPAVALAELVSHVVVINSNVNMTESVLMRCLSIVKKIRHYELYFLPDDKFWLLL